MKRLTSKTEFYITIFVIAVVIIGLFSLGSFGFNTLSAVRAYVGGEGLWAKNQKEACYQLVQYVYTRDQARYEIFLESLRVPLGDRAARLELEKVDSDDDVTSRGFLEGGNHPDDISHMIALHKRFKGSKHIRKSIEQWEIGDQLIAELIKLGEVIQHQISSGDATQVFLDKSIVRIDDLQSQLSNVENQFSFHMSMASRWAANLLTKIMAVFTIMGSAICLGMLFFVARIISELKKYSSDLKIKVENERAIKKELEEERDKLQEAFAEIKTLRGIIPICSYCKQIRNDEGIWSQLEQYMHQHTDAEFSHSLCPECYKTQMEEFD